MKRWLCGLGCHGEIGIGSACMVGSRRYGNKESTNACCVRYQWSSGAPWRKVTQLMLTTIRWFQSHWSKLGAKVCLTISDSASRSAPLHVTIFGELGPGYTLTLNPYKVCIFWKLHVSGIICIGFYCSNINTEDVGFFSEYIEWNVTKILKSVLRGAHFYWYRGTKHIPISWSAL